ncbi:MAG TPA: hypothetical protein VK427_04105 [Kofleriaceae bacterium]|nr:hypothetical protein [Kofleriaceae bacterium]
MGYRCRWIALRGRDRDDVLAKLKFAIETELDEEVYDPGLYAVDVGAWLVIIGDGWDYMDLVTRRAAARLSTRGEVLYLYTDDTPMSAELTSFVDGQVSWSLTYESDGTYKPVVEGTLPPEGKPILGACLKAQKEAGPKADTDHVYDVVAELGRALVGFRHDQTLSSGKYLPIYQLKAAS